MASPPCPALLAGRSVGRSVGPRTRHGGHAARDAADRVARRVAQEGLARPGEALAPHRQLFFGVGYGVWGDGCHGMLWMAFMWHYRETVRALGWLLVVVYAWVSWYGVYNTVVVGEKPVPTAVEAERPTPPPPVFAAASGGRTKAPHDDDASALLLVEASAGAESALCRVHSFSCACMHAWGDLSLLYTIQDIHAHPEPERRPPPDRTQRVVHTTPPTASSKTRRRACPPPPAGCRRRSHLHRPRGPQTAAGGRGSGAWRPTPRR